MKNNFSHSSVYSVLYTFNLFARKVTVPSIQTRAMDARAKVTEMPLKR